MKLSDLSELFEQAISIDDEQIRSDFVLSSCPDESSRLKLSRLVAAHMQTGCVVDEPEAAIRIARDLNEEGDDSYHGSPVHEGQRVGNYKLLQRIGEGGMGVVFMAEQLQPIQRRVAIKVIKTSNNSRQVLARFEAERSALARLDHGNITRIIDAGVTDSGAPFFVMELVRGDSLTEYCDRHKLPIRDRIELLEQVCLAVHHAHQKGIIHRDIKPANIMVTLYDGEPIPKVIDFGIAKALDRPLVEGTLFTRYGDMVGTPQYMSPEQAEKSGLDLDVRTDIYSLGALLFELLTGTPPIEPKSLDGKGILGILETVRDNDTESPSTRATRFMALDDSVANRRGTDQKQLSRLLRGELDWIALKALARDRTLRYESAAAMARDLRAYLDGDTVDAAAPSFIYQARKLFQRHRTIGVAAAACAVLLLAMTLVSFSWAVANNQLKKIATERADELNMKSQRLQELNDELRIAIARAQGAEQKAWSLANEKKEQAAFERATRRHFTKIMLLEISKVPLLSSVKGEGPIDLEKLEQALSRKLSSSLLGTDGTQRRVTATTVGSLVDFDEAMDFPPDVGDLEAYAIEIPPRSEAKLPWSKDARIENGIPRPDSPSIKVGVSTRSQGIKMSALIFNAVMPEPNQMSNLLIEEYRNEFGDHHPKVAEALIFSCQIGISNGELSADVIDSRLRECLGIVGDLDDPQNTATRVSANTLLSQKHFQEGRIQDAMQRFEEANNEFENSESRLDESTAALLSDSLQLVEKLISARSPK